MYMYHDIILIETEKKLIIFRKRSLSSFAAMTRGRIKTLSIFIIKRLVLFIITLFLFIVCNVIYFKVKDNTAFVKNQIKIKCEF